MSERTVQRVGAKVVVRSIDNAGCTMRALTVTSKLRLQGSALAAALARPDVQSTLTDVSWRTGAGHVTGVSVVYGGLEPQLIPVRDTATGAVAEGEVVWQGSDGALDQDLELMPEGPQRGRIRLYDDLLARLAGAPVVASAGITQRLPLEGEAFVEALVPAGETPTDPTELAGLLGNYRMVSPDYFETLGMVLTRGRLFTGQDRGRPVAVVTAQTASRLWPGEDPIGQRFLRGNNPDRPSQEVVGVVADARILGLDVDPGLVAYLPYWELAPSNATVVARGGADTATVLVAVRESVRGLDPLLPASNVRVLDDVLAASVAVRRFLLQVTAGFAVGGLVLVCLGVFGTVSQRVVRRRREFAIRLALGTTRGGIVRHVCARGLRPVAAGLAAGLVLALAAARSIDALLFGVAPLDPVVLGGAALVMLGLAAGACLVPAARALRAPLARTLRAD